MVSREVSSSWLKYNRVYKIFFIIWGSWVYESTLLYLGCERSWSSFTISVRWVNRRSVNSWRAVFEYRCRMNSVTNLLYDGVESVMRISGVVDDANSAVGFVQTVGSFDDVTIAYFLLALDVASVRIVYTIVVRVLRYSLQ